MNRLLIYLPLLAFVLWVNAFYVLDSDFWWHVTAGRVMVETGGLIQTDPFAFTRTGLPYLAVHEWLAQIILYAVHTIGGSTGIILLRGALMAGVIGVLVTMTRKNLALAAIVGALSAVAMRHGFLERPQMFSALLLAIDLRIIFALLRRPDRPWKLLGGLVAVQVIWVNMHGAAALLALVPLGALGLQMIHDDWRARVGVTKIISSLTPYLITGVLLIVALVISPSTIDNLTYVFSLLTDNTITFIREWNPRPWPIYLKAVGPMMLVTTGALVLGKKHLVMCISSLLIFALLSRDAARHELMLIILMLGISVYQISQIELKSAPAKRCSFVISILGVILVFCLSQSGRNLLAHHGLLGFGSFEPASGAVDFMERVGIRHSTYNNYGIGGYLLYRGYPDRKIFMDGRNVDYGYSFLEPAIAASQNEEKWAEIENVWGLTSAVLTFDASKPEFGPYPFAHLHRNTDWALVYIDDHAAVYLKKVPENMAVIEAYQYLLLQPQYLDRDEMFKHVEDNQAVRFEQELVASIENDPNGVKALLNLAKLYRLSGLYDKSVYLLNEAIKRKPNDYELYQEYAAVLIGQELYAEAAIMYEKTIKLASLIDAEVNYATVAEVYERAGDEKKAAVYRKKAGK